jgi:hypothetical protein
MISKTQLQNGVAFKYKTNMYSIKSTLEVNNDINDYYYVANFAGYVGNVDKIGTKSFTVFTYVMSKQVKIKINYSECEPVVEYFK